MNDQQSKSRGFLTLMAMEARFQLTRPMFWMLLLILLLFSWGLSIGNLTIQSGDSTVGGRGQAHITSEFAVAQMLQLLTFLLYSFFVAVAAGMAIPQDDELQVGPLLHSTRLRPKEYVWAKFGAVLALFLVVLTVHLLLTMFHLLYPEARFH